jgi:hypothetical protein
MADNDVIAQAMGILGGKKKDAAAAPQKPLLPRALREATATPPAPAPAPQVIRETTGANAKFAKAERIVVKELARYATLHATLLELKYELEKGGNPALLEQRLDATLQNAKVVIK